MEALGLEISSRDGVIKMLRGSMVVLKGVQCNNLYYLKGNTVTGQVASSISSYDDVSNYYMCGSDIQVKSLCKV